jgi:hypothetical protein
MHSDVHRGGTTGKERGGRTAENKQRNLLETSDGLSGGCLTNQGRCNFFFSGYLKGQLGRRQFSGEAQVIFAVRQILEEIPIQSLCAVMENIGCSTLR